VSTPAAALRVLLVDDESLARMRLRSLVHDCLAPHAQVVGEAANAIQARAWLVEHPCDVVLLDVQMPGLDGTHLAAELQAQAASGQQVPAVVFVTAHAEHALHAFDLNAVDYLTKPVKRERLHGALQRVAMRLANSPAQPSSRQKAAAEAAVMVVMERGRVLHVPLAEVLYLKAELKYVTLRTATHTHLLDGSLSDLEAELGNRFLRVHRNALVARSALRLLERRHTAGEAEGGESWAVCVAPLGEWLAVSRRQVAAVKEALMAAGHNQAAP
jgi:two-component system, LytTR family, response regulator AlgR